MLFVTGYCIATLIITWGLTNTTMLQKQLVFIFRYIYGRDRMVVRSIIAYEISIYNHFTLRVRFPSWWGVLDTPLCNKFFHWLSSGQWFSLDTQVFSTNKTDHHNITSILSKLKGMGWVSGSLKSKRLESDLKVWASNQIKGPQQDSQHVSQGYICTRGRKVALTILLTSIYIFTRFLFSMESKLNTITCFQLLSDI